MKWIKILNSNKSRLPIWGVFALPAFYASAKYFFGHSSYGAFIHTSGGWAVGFLLVAMLVTPLRRHLPQSAWVKALVYHRRAIGVASFMYASVHTAVYLERKWGANLILKEGAQVELASGWIAMALMAALAITSNNTSLRLLKSSWKRLHRSVYIIAVLIFAHWILTAFEPGTAYFWLVLFMFSQVARFIPRR